MVYQCVRLLNKMPAWKNYAVQTVDPAFGYPVMPGQLPKTDALPAKKHGQVSDSIESLFLARLSLIGTCADTDLARSAIPHIEQGFVN